VSDAAAVLGPADLEACLSLDRLALQGLWSRQQWSTELEDPRRPCLGLSRNGALVAVASGWLVADELHITAVAVHPEQRRQGLGSQVLQALLQEAANQGALHATLEVAASNQAAQALYAAAGFRTAGVRRAYYRNGDDALIQWLRLRDGEEVRITGYS
jgi:ribosomal-protein-alanine N-acetyltransferase